MGSTVDEWRPDLSHGEGERQSEADGGRARPKDLAVALLSLKCSSAVSLSPNKRAPSKGMSMRLAWTTPKKQVLQSHAWRLSATEEAMALPTLSVVSRSHPMVNFEASSPS